MSARRTDRGAAGEEFTEAERRMILFIRGLGIDEGEVLRRLATSSGRPLLPCGQELHANYGAVSEGGMEIGSPPAPAGRGPGSSP